MTTATMDKVNYTIKLDRDTRDAFSRLCDTIGITMSAGINALVKQAVRQQGMSFSALDVNGMTVTEAAELRRRADEAERGMLAAHELLEA